MSSVDQNAERQLVDIKLDKIFTDRASGRDANRPALSELLAYVRQGDTVVVHSLDRLARNLEDLRALIRQLIAKGIKIEFVKESLSFSGEASPMAQLLLNVMGSFAEFERSLIRERQREGIALAKAKGVYRGRHRVLKEDQVAWLKQQVAAGVKKAKLARELGISRETVHRYLRLNVPLEVPR